MTTIEIATKPEQLDTEFWKVLHGLPGRDYALSDFSAFLMEALGDREAVGIWLAREEGRIVGFLIALPPDAIAKCAFVLTAYATGLTKEIREEILGQLYTWAKSLGARAIGMVTERREDVWTRAYGYKPAGAYMRKELV